MRYGYEPVVECGMAEEHAELFCAAARLFDVFILVRATAPLCTGLIREAYPAKGIDIQGEISDWGPQAGFVCVDQRLSRRWKHPAEIRIANSQIQRSLEIPGVAQVPLTLSRSRLDELKERGIIDHRPVSSHWEANSRQDVPSSSARAQRRDLLVRCLTGDSRRSFVAQYEGQDGYGIHHYDARKRGGVGEPVRVLARGSRAFTAGYDLLTICPNGEVLGLAGGETPPPASDPSVNGPTVRYGRSGPYCPLPARPGAPSGLTVRVSDEWQRYTDPDSWNYASGVSHPAETNLPIRQDQIVLYLNEAFRRLGYGGGKLLRHSAQKMRPGADLGYPILMFPPIALPREDGNFDDGPRVLDRAIDEPDAELSQVYRQIQARGYRFQIHPAWSFRPPRVGQRAQETPR
jgi:hypothetical protein